MKKILIQICSIMVASLLMYPAFAQAPADTTTEFKPHGKLWGYGFGDYAFKGGSDDMNRGNSNQYTNVPVNSNLFQWRRLYLGYNYEISKKFVAEFLLAAEDDWAAGTLGQPAAAVTVNTVTGTSTKVGLGNNGDILMNGKFSPYVKLANLRWRNIFRGSDLVIGQAPAPAFAQGSALKEYARNTQTSEEVWGYRSVERTITDIRRTPSFDMGVALQGQFDAKGNYGYDVMVGNGQSARPENDNFKWFYGDIWAKFFDKKVVVDLYQDFQEQRWGVPVKGPEGMWYNDRNMTKLFVAYNTSKLTVGVEAFMNTILGDAAVTGKDGNTYYRTSKATGVSLFVKGRITKDQLGFFARFDNYDPTGNLKNIADEANTKAISFTTTQYDPFTKEMFTTFGLDYTPVKNVHIMPNVWLNTYESGLDASKYSGLNAEVTNRKGTDAVYRITFYYMYGK